MKKALISIICSLAALALCACSDSAEFTKRENLTYGLERSSDKETTFNYTDGALSPPNVYNSYASEITDFELKLFRCYADLNGSDGSYVFSPINTALALGLIADGAADRTRANIIGALGNDLTADDINQCSSYFYSRISAFNTEGDGDEKASFVKLKTSLLFNNTVDVRKSFLQLDADYFGFDIYRFDFSGGTAADKVNALFADYTSGSAMESLDSEDNLIVLSCADILDSWLSSYALSDISEGIFNSSDGEETVNYMTLNDLYLHTDKAEGILKYTESTPLKFLAILPNEGVSVEEYISSFTYLEYTSLLDSMEINSYVSASIPEFSAEGGSGAESLKDILSECGLSDIFTDGATFSGVSLSDTLFVDDILAVTPQISVSAAGIGGLESAGGASFEEHSENYEAAQDSLIFDRPFIFMLIDNESGIPVCIGAVDI